jgi:hypothetical protein
MISKYWTWRYADLRSAIKNYAELSGIPLPENDDDKSEDRQQPEREISVPRSTAIPRRDSSSIDDDDVPF